MSHTYELGPGPRGREGGGLPLNKKRYSAQGTTFSFERGTNLHLKPAPQPAKAPAVSKWTHFNDSLLKAPALS
jgi:hypothetical protein